MEILLSTDSLAGMGGSETYVITVADHLQRLGHEVRLHAFSHGLATEQARELGLRIVDGHQLPDPPDVVVVQDAICAYELADAYPEVPQVFVAHSDTFDLSLPPQLPGVVEVAVALYDRVERRLRALAAPPEIVRLTQPVDVNRYKPTRPIRRRPKVALALGNYLLGRRLELIGDVCAASGLELRQIGATASGARPFPVAQINEADVVFGKARVICEAMSCARAAYVLDHNGGEGWVTTESYPALSADNFGGQSQPTIVDTDRLTADLEAYDAGMGIVNRDLVVAHHAASKHAAALAELLRRVVGTHTAPPAPYPELARMVRLYHRADSHAFGLNAQLDQLGRRVNQLEAELEPMRARAAEAAQAEWEARSEVRVVRAALEEAWSNATYLQKRLGEIEGSRRWRALRAAFSLWDRLRGRGRP